jgi:membrane-associated phospholipid phosphatase
MQFLTSRFPFGLNGRTWPWFLAGFVAITAFLIVLDPRISQAAVRLPDSVRGFFFWVTDFGESAWILIPALALFVVSAVLGALISKPTPKRALWQMAQLYAFVFVGIGLPSLLANVVKRIVGRGRPELYDTIGPLGFQNFFNDFEYQSYVSGHAATSFAMAFVIGFLSPRWFPAALIVAILISLSRVIIGVHYPSDVFGGAVVGMLGAYAVRNVFATRRWGFEVRSDGGAELRPFSAVLRLFRSRRRTRR